MSTHLFFVKRVIQPIQIHSPIYPNTVFLSRVIESFVKPQLQLFRESLIWRRHEIEEKVNANQVTSNPSAVYGRGTIEETGL